MVHGATLKRIKLDSEDYLLTIITCLSVQKNDKMKYEKNDMLVLL